MQCPSMHLGGVPTRSYQDKVPGIEFPKRAPHDRAAGTQTPSLGLTGAGEGSPLATLSHLRLLWLRKELEEVMELQIVLYLPRA